MPVLVFLEHIANQISVLRSLVHTVFFFVRRRPSGVEEEYFVQLFFEIDPKQEIIPFTEMLLWKMFKEQNISFTKVCLHNNIVVVDV